RPRELRGKAGLLLDEVTAHVHNLVHVLDEYRAGLLTGPASGAGPQHIVVDEPFTYDVLPHLPVSLPQLLGNHLLLVLIEVVPQIKEELARSQPLPAHGGRTVGGAPAALGATVHVEGLLPGKLVNV